MSMNFSASFAPRSQNSTRTDSKPQSPRQCFCVALRKLCIAGAILLSAASYGQDTTNTGDWNVNADGSWSDPSRWLNGVIPNGVGDTADVVHAINGTRTITMDIPVTLGTLRMGDNNNSNPFVILGTGGLTFDNGGAGAVFDRSVGLLHGGPDKSPSSSERLDVAVTLNDDLTMYMDRNIELRGLWTATDNQNINIFGEGRVYFNPGTGSSITGVDTITVADGELRFDDAGNHVGVNTINVGDGVAGSQTRYFARLYMVNTDIEQTVDVNLNGGWLINDIGLLNDHVLSGNITVTGAASTNIIDVNDGGTPEVHHFTGVISGTGGFSKLNTGAMMLHNDNTFEGEMHVNRGRSANLGSVHLTGADGAVSATSGITVSRDGNFYIDNSGAINNNRVNDSASLTLGMMGQVRLIGNAGAATSEKMGDLHITSGVGRINIDLNDSTPQQTTFTFDTFQRDVGSVAQFQVIDNVAGTLGTSAQFRIADGGAATHQTGSGGANGTTNKSVVIGAVGGVGEIPDRLMTFDSSDPTLLRALDFNTEYLLSQNLVDNGVAHTLNRTTIQGNDQNVMIDYNTVRADNPDPNVDWFGPRPVRVTESIAINSLSFGTNTPNDPGNSLNNNDIGSVLVLDHNAVIYLGDKAAGDGIGAVTDSGSGMLVFGRDVNGSVANSTQYIAGGAIDFGSREAIMINESGASAIIRSEIRGTGGITKAGAQTIYFDYANTYTGTTRIAEGLIDVRHSQGLGGSTLVNVVGTAGLYLELGVEISNVDLVLSDIASSHTAFRSNSGHNIWNGDIIVDNVDALGQVIFTPYINVSTGDTLTLNGTIYGTALTNPSARDINLSDSRIISTESSAAGIININGSFQDTVNGAIGAISGPTENDLLRFQVTGNDELVVNVRQQWNAAGRILVEQGIMRYEGEGNFWSDDAAAAIVATNGQSGMRFSGSTSGDVANINFILTKDGQKLNIDRFDIGSGGSSDNYNDLGNIVLSGANTSGTVTFGNGKSVLVYGASDATRSHTRDLAVFAAGGGTVNMDFRLDDSDTDVHTSFTKIGNGVVNLRGDNTTSAGDVEQVNLAGGLLRLTNYGTSTGSRFDNGAMVVFAGGSLELDGVGSIANETENFTGTAVGGAITMPAGSAQTIVGPGASNVIVTSDTGRTTTLNIGSSGVALNRQSGGTLNFIENGNGGIAAITLNGSGAPTEGTAIGWATYGTTYDSVTQTANALDFAMVDANGAVSMFSGSTREEVDSAAAWTVGSDVSEGALGFSGATAAGMEVNTVHFDFDGSSSLTVDAGGLTVTSGGIMVSSAVVTAGSTKEITGGDLRAGFGGDLIVHQYGADSLTIGSNIVDNSGTALVKTGSGELILTGTNTYTGGTHVNGGTLTVSSLDQLGAAPAALETANIRINGGTLHTTGDMVFEANRGIEIGGNGGGLTIDDGTTVTYGGAITSAPNINTNSSTAQTTGTFVKSGGGTLFLTGTDNTFTGLLDIREGTVRWDVDGFGSNTVTLFGTHREFLDGTILRSGATIDLNSGTATTSSNVTTTIEEWFMFEAGSTLSTSLISTTDDPADRNYSLRGVIHIDAMGNAGTAAGAMVMNIGRRGINLNDDGGYLTGDGGIMKVGAGALYFRDSSPEWTGQLIITEGAVHAYSAGYVFGTGDHPILLGHDGNATGEVASGNTLAGLYIRNESGLNSLPTITQDIIVRNENGLGSQTKRLGAYYLIHEDVANYNGSITLNDNVEFYYQDDARDSSNTTSSSQVRNDTRTFHAPENAEFVTINYNGDISGTGGISTNVAQGGTANTANGSITGAMDDLVMRTTFGLNGDNRNWTGVLTISNNNGSTTAADDVDRFAYVRLGNEYALNDNLVRFGNRGYLQLAGIDKTFTQDFQYIGAVGTATTAKIQNASDRDITLTFHADGTKVGPLYQDVGVGMEDGERYGGLPENQGVLNVLKTGAGNTVFGAATGGGEIADAFSSYTGTTTIQEGILYAGSNNSFSTNSRFIVNDGAELSLYWDQALTGFDNTIGSLEGGAGALVDVENSTLRMGGDGTTGADFAGVISGIGNVYKTGTGSQRLSGNNTFISSEVSIINGTLIGGSNEAFGDAFNIISLGGVSLVTVNPLDARVELLLDGAANAVDNAVMMNTWDGNDEGITIIGTRATSGSYGFTDLSRLDGGRSFFARADGTSTFTFGGQINDYGMETTITKVGTGTVELGVLNYYGPYASSGSAIDGGTVVRHGTISVLDSDALGATVVELGDRRQVLAGGVNLATTGSLISKVTGSYDPAGGSTATGAFVDVRAEIDGVQLTAGDVGKRVLVKDELGNPERNGIYEVVSVDVNKNTMTLVRTGDFDEAGEMVYGTSVTVSEGTQAGSSYFMASQDVSTVGGDEYDPVYWEQDLTDADVALVAGAADLTIFNDIDINDTNDNGASIIGGLFTSGNSYFHGNITLQHQEGVDNIREVTLTSASDTESIDGELGTVFSGILSEAQLGDTMHVRIAGGGSVTLTSDAHSYTGKTTVGTDSSLVLHGSGSIASSPWLELEAGAEFDTSRVNGGTYTIESTVSGVGTLQPGAGNTLVIDGAGVIRPGLSSQAYVMQSAGDQVGAITVNGNLVLTGDASGVERLVLGMGSSGGADFNDGANFAANSSNLNSWLLTQGDTYDSYTGGNHDRLTINGNLTLEAGGQIHFDNNGGNAYNPQFGDVFNLVDWSTLTDNGFDEGGVTRGGGLWGDLFLPELGGGLFYNTSLFGSHGIVVVVPEPSRAVLLCGAFAVLLLRRRRSSPRARA